MAVCLPQSAQLIWCGQGISGKGGGKQGENLAGYLQIKQGTPREEGKERETQKKIGSLIPSNTWNWLMISVVGEERKSYLKGEAQRTGPSTHHLFF